MGRATEFLSRLVFERLLNVLIIMAHLYVDRIRSEMDESSYMDMFNAILCYNKKIVNPAELVSYPTINCQINTHACLYAKIKFRSQ